MGMQVQWVWQASPPLGGARANQPSAIPEEAFCGRRKGWSGEGCSGMLRGQAALPMPTGPGQVSPAPVLGIFLLVSRVEPS